MKNKLLAIIRLIFARDYLVMTDSSLIGKTSKSPNGVHIKKFIEATMEAKEREVSGG